MTEVPAEFEEDIAEVKAIREFGESLGFDYGTAFTELDLSRKHPALFLYASLKYRIHSAVPGWTTEKPYEAYEGNKEFAMSRSAELMESGYDVLVFEAELHGAKHCPITRSLLECQSVRKQNGILHEGFHMFLTFHQIYLPYPLEEAIACYIGSAGSLEYCKAHNTGLIEAANIGIRDWRLFSDFVNRNCALLEEFYKEVAGDYAAIQGFTEETRRPMLEKIRSEAQDLKSRCDTDAVVYRLSADINNAFFLRYIDYTKFYPLVWEMFEADQVSIQDYLSNPEPMNKKLKKLVTA